MLLSQLIGCAVRFRVIVVFGCFKFGCDEFRHRSQSNTPPQIKRWVRNWYYTHVIHSYIYCFYFVDHWVWYHIISLIAIWTPKKTVSVFVIQAYTSRTYAKHSQIVGAHLPDFHNCFPNQCEKFLGRVVFSVNALKHFLMLFFWKSI